MLSVQIRVRLPYRLLHAHPQLHGHRADDVDRPLDLEVIANRGAVEDDFDVADAPHFAELLIAEDRLEAEGVEELDGQLETLHAGLHFLARLDAAALDRSRP